LADHIIHSLMADDFDVTQATKLPNDCARLGIARLWICLPSCSRRHAAAERADHFQCSLRAESAVGAPLHRAWARRASRDQELDRAQASRAGRIRWIDPLRYR